MIIYKFSDGTIDISRLTVDEEQKVKLDAQYAEKDKDVVSIEITDEKTIERIDRGDEFKIVKDEVSFADEELKDSITITTDKTEYDIDDGITISIKRPKFEGDMIIPVGIGNDLRLLKFSFKEGVASKTIHNSQSGYMYLPAKERLDGTSQRVEVLKLTITE